MKAPSIKLDPSHVKMNFKLFYKPDRATSEGILDKACNKTSTNAFKPAVQTRMSQESFIKLVTSDAF